MSEDDFKRLWQFVIAVVFAYEMGKNQKESELGKIIASDDDLWSKFFGGDNKNGN